MCYLIWLGMFSQKVTIAAVGSQDAMVKSKFFSSLPLGLLNQINIQLGHLTEVSLSQVVRLAAVSVAQWRRGVSHRQHW